MDGAVPNWYLNSVFQDGCRWYQLGEAIAVGDSLTASLMPLGESRMRDGGSVLKNRRTRKGSVSSNLTRAVVLTSCRTALGTPALCLPGRQLPP